MTINEKQMRKELQLQIVRKTLIILTLKDSVETLRRNHNIKVRSYGGATTRDMVDHIKRSHLSKPDVIIIHAGTIDLTKEEKTYNKFPKHC